MFIHFRFRKVFSNKWSYFYVHILYKVAIRWVIVMPSGYFNVEVCPFKHIFPLFRIDLFVGFILTFYGFWPCHFKYGHRTVSLAPLIVYILLFNDAALVLKRNQKRNHV